MLLSIRYGIGFSADFSCHITQYDRLHVVIVSIYLFSTIIIIFINDYTVHDLWPFWNKINIKKLLSYEIYF